MNTTLLFAELLIIGLQSVIWLLLLAFNFLGFGWLQALKAVSDWQTLIAVASLSVLYVLGIVIDRVADFSFYGWDCSLKNRILPGLSFSSSAVRFDISKDNEFLNRQFEYTRSRLRIARASSLNFAISTVLLVILIVRVQAPNEAALLFFSVLLGILLTAGSVYAWRTLAVTYYKMVKGNYDLLQSKQENPGKHKK